MNEWGKRNGINRFALYANCITFVIAYKQHHIDEKKHEEIMDHHNAAGLFHGCASSTVHHRLRP
mgnify:FL=1